MKQIAILCPSCKNVLMTVLFSLLICCCTSFTKKGQRTGPVAGKPWSLPLPGDATLPMAWIAPGTFTMGSPETEEGRKADESLQTMVTLTKGYWLGKTLVTIGEWKAVTGQSLRDKVIKLLHDETLYDFDGKKMKERDFMHFDQNTPDKIMANEDDRLPMYFVSWNEAMDFCRKLTEQERANGRLPAGYEYSLPTEAQWEYACRAGTTGATYYSDGNLDNIAWYVNNSATGYAGRGLGTPPAGPRDVGSKLPNKWGMQDMLGNIWEWCRDWYGPYRGGNVTDPLGPDTGAYRVNRGGSFGSGANDERSANRAKNPPNEDSAYRGFRIALCAVQR
jgi:formylglycine-generating enzyme required for sulfatase activity